MASVVDKDKGFKAIKKELLNCKILSAKVGVLGAKDARKNKGEADFVVNYALANEFGTEHIPKRSFLLSTEKEQKHKWYSLIEDGYDKIISGSGTALATLDRVARIARDDIVLKISSNIPPPNAPSTIEQKTKDKGGITRTLIDTGRLRSSIDYVIVYK